MFSRLINIFRFNRAFWWLACLLLLANIFFSLVFSRRQEARIDALQRTYNERRSAPEININNDQNRLLKAVEDIDSFVAALPERKDFAETAAELLSIFKRHQIEVGKTVYRPESIDYDGLYKYVTSLSIKGSYSTIKAVLADIQESKTLFCIESLSVSKDQGEGLVEMQVKIATYFR